MEKKRARESGERGCVKEGKKGKGCGGGMCFRRVGKGTEKVSARRSDAEIGGWNRERGRERVKSKREG